VVSVSDSSTGDEGFRAASSSSADSGFASRVSSSFSFGGDEVFSAPGRSVLLVCICLYANLSCVHITGGISTEGSFHERKKTLLSEDSLLSGQCKKIFNIIVYFTHIQS
jgi:hypothetical protein